MTHKFSVTVDFTRSAHQVYEALTDLGNYPRWSSGMTSISYTGRMHPGLSYETSSEVLGRLNQAQIEVVSMVPDQRIELKSSSGIVNFEAALEIKKRSAEACSLTCALDLTFSRALFNLAKPVAEALAEIRIRGDLESLRDSLG